MNNTKAVERISNAATAYLAACDEMRACAYEWAKTDLGNQLTDEDVTGVLGDDVDVAAVTSAVSTFEAVETLNAAGHATNLYRLKR